MGFGILFIGYLISLNSIAYPGFTKILGCLVMLLAMTRLGQYNRHLKSAAYTLIPSTIVALFYLFIETGAMFSLFAETERTLLFQIVPLAMAICELVFLFQLMRGLQALAVETDVKILEIASFRNRLFTVVYYLLYIAGMFDYGAAAITFMRYFGVAIMLLGLVIFFLNAKLIFNFYMWICLPEDLDMKRKPSRFAPLERFLSWIDAAEDKRLKRRQEVDAAYRAEKTHKKDRRKKK